MLLLQELQCFSHSLERGDSAQRWCCLSKKTLRDGQYSFKEQTEFTIQPNLLDPHVSNIKDSITRAAVFLPFTCMSWFCTKMMFLILGNTERREYSLKQHTQFSMLKMVLNHLLLTLMIFLEELRCFFFHIKGAVLHKVDIPHPWKRWQAGSVRFKC
jgi:hypothetical protein